MFTLYQFPSLTKTILLDDFVNDLLSPHCLHKWMFQMSNTECSLFYRVKNLAIKRPASPEEEEDTSSERKDHLASATTNRENEKNSDKASKNQSTTPNPSPRKSTTPPKQKNSVIGTKLNCHVRGKTGNLEGVLKWIGYLPTLPKTKDNIVAGIELVKKNKLGTDGSFMGKKYFTAAPKHGYFVRYKDCKKVN